MVDFALLLEPARDSSPLRSALESLVRSLPLSHKFVNATAYGKLQVCPAPVAIETKLGSGDEDEAKAQLGVWVAAWFARMSLLCSEGEGGAGVISVPTLLISGTTWAMYHASNTGDAVVSHFFGLAGLMAASVGNCATFSPTPRFELTNAKVSCHLEIKANVKPTGQTRPLANTVHVSWFGVFFKCNRVLRKAISQARYEPCHLPFRAQSSLKIYSTILSTPWISPSTVPALSSSTQPRV